jgi:predicted lysophospholipase L1 biosynthesis ABC-type transport system permease subunit
MASTAPPGIDLYGNAQGAITGFVASTWALAVIAVILRFVSRRIARAGYWMDDWLMLPALAIYTLLTFIAGMWRTLIS